MTFDSVPRLVTPELSATLIPPSAAGPAGRTGMAGMPGMAVGVQVPKPALAAPLPNAAGPRLKNAAKAAGPQLKGALAAPPAPPGPLNLTFNLQEAPWLGDLGLYLAEKVVPGTPQATIQVRGSGAHAMTPIRLPDGVSIAILGDSADGAAPTMPTFVPKAGAAGRSMIELHGGDLAIAHLGFSSEGSPRPKHWVLSEDGLLAIKHCRFRDPTPAAGAQAGGAIVAFVARGTAPIAPRVGGFVKESNRPAARLLNCSIWTGGDAISAEAGRGAVILENCLIISGGPAATLLPVDVARDKFEADLVFDRCTVAVDRTGVLLGPMAGEPTGPSRPWLVTTRRCAFPRTQLAGGAGALLQVDPDAMARGLLFWQSSYDVYDGYHFVAPTGPSPPNPPPTDLKKQWIDLWGEGHAKGDQGPTPRRNETTLRYKDKDRPRPGKVVPAALELDKGIQPDLGVDFKELPTFAALRLPADGAGIRAAPGSRLDAPGTRSDRP